MTMPHLQNCDHSEEGWCLDCVKKLWDEHNHTKNNPPPDPLYQHTSAELRHVADILDILNKSLGNYIGIDGELEVYWCDRVMGVIGLDDKEDLTSWVYYPSANNNFELKAERINQ